ncbi:MAG TPA: protoporphyrinogen oxidase, partial [Myxococcaceae bacterium]|nr:protoporphyrinogen oxidase [Myxococcaceae bacterium]
GELGRAMARALGERVRLSSPATSLQRIAEGWRLTTPGGTVESPRLVLAVPTFEAARLVRGLDGGLAEALDAFPYTGVAVVHLGFRPALEPDPEGFGFLVPSGERRDILGVLYASSAFPFRAPGGGTLLTVLLGGAHRPDLLARDDAALVGTARAELRALLGVERAPSLTEVFRWPRAIPQYEVGHASRLERVEALAARWPGLWLTGNAYRGAGVADCVRSSREMADRLLAG